MNAKLKQAWVMLVGVLLTAMLAGCGASSVKVEGDFPTPLVEQLPLTMGVYWSEAFSQYIYSEAGDGQGRPDWNIDAGGAQTKMFKGILPVMFDQVVVLDSLPEDSPLEVDAIFYPQVEDLQFAVPRDTKSNVFEVWIKYKLQLLNNRGAVIADWILTAYGKTPEEFMTSQEAAINEAANVALRDAGAGFIVGFQQNDDIKQWLINKPQ